MPQAPTPKRPLKVFLCHASVDRAAVRDLYKKLEVDGIDAWLDTEDLFPGQKWEDEIPQAIRKSDVVIVCLSEKSVNKDGYVQKEIKFALDIADEKNEDTIFIIPVRLDDCIAPNRLNTYQWVNLFDENGYSKLIQALRLRSDKINTTLQIKKKSLPKTGVQQRAVTDEAVQNQAEDETPVEDDKKSVLSKLHPSIIVAIIGLVGTIVAALIGARGLGLWPAPTPTNIPATSTGTHTPTSVPTYTTLPDTPTFTPIPATDTPIPTFTPLPIALGEDWLAGCISTLWKIYPSNIQAIEKGDGCWKEPLHTFSAENGDLDFLAERGKGTSEIYGLFVLLPESGTVTFTARLRELNNADLWMGVFTEPDINSPGLLMAILNGNVNSRAVVQKDPSTYETLQGSQGIPQGNGFSISFRFNALSATSIVNPHVFVINSVSMPSTQKWLFLGYKGLNNRYRIDGTFLNFELK